MLQTIMSAFLLFSMSLVQAKKLDINTHDQVIDKLESTLAQINEVKIKSNIHIRLADLYADRARLKLIEIEDQNCETCLDFKQDRYKAIKHYQQAFPFADKYTQPRILIQKAHLFSLNGDLDSAEKVFIKVINSAKSYSADLVGLAYSGLGEIQYKKSDYSNAKISFQTALKISNKLDPFSQYRLAWCELNLGNTHIAKKIILDLLKSDFSLEPSFRKDILRDLATFTAKTEINTFAINELMSLSDDKDKKNNLFYLGQECDRLGNKKGALLVWSAYSQLDNVSTDEALEVQIRTAQNMLDQQSYEESLSLYSKATANLAKHTCKEKEICEEIKARTRLYVHGWIKKEKSKPSTHLLNGLAIYVKYNSRDIEMLNWAGHVARSTQQNNLAADYYHLAAEESARQLSQNELTQTKEFTIKTLESSLLAEIEMAELTQNILIKTKAYQHYLKLNPRGAKRSEVLYQLAYILYQKGEYIAAAENFNHIVTAEKNVSSALKVQAADLALDALAVAKKSEALETFAKTYANILPHKKQEYYSVARKAAINQSVDLFANGKGNETDIKKAVLKLNAAVLVGATPDEQIKIAKNKMIMSENIKDLNGVDDSASQLLRIQQLSHADRDLALQKQLWVAEMQLNFKKAFVIAKKANLTHLREDHKQLKLALLADLAGASSNRYYKAYFKIAKNSTEANLVRLKLIKAAKYPWALLDKYKSELTTHPEIIAEAVAVSFVKYNSLNKLKNYAENHSVRRSSLSGTFNRFIKIDEDQKFDREIKIHKIISKPDSKLKETLAKRISLLSQADRLARKQVRANDFSMQLITLSRVVRENQKMYKDILSLPVPNNLTKLQKSDYNKLIQAQAEPYKKYAAEVDEEITNLISKSKAYKQLLHITKNDISSFQGLAVYELRKIQNVNPKVTNEISRALANQLSKPSAKDVLSARTSLIKSPFDVPKAEKLKKLEEISGGTSMVAFLEGRLDQINKERP